MLGLLGVLGGIMRVLDGHEGLWDDTGGALKGTVRILRGCWGSTGWVLGVLGGSCGVLEALMGYWRHRENPGGCWEPWRALELG